MVDTANIKLYFLSLTRSFVCPLIQNEKAKKHSMFLCFVCINTECQSVYLSEYEMPNRVRSCFPTTELHPTGGERDTGGEDQQGGQGEPHTDHLLQ